MGKIIKLLAHRASSSFYNQI